VRNDSPLFPEIGPDLLGETEVGRAVAVQVADLATAEFERQLTQVTRCRMDAGPGRDLCEISSLADRVLFMWSLLLSRSVAGTRDSLQVQVHLKSSRPEGDGRGTTPNELKRRLGDAPSEMARRGEIRLGTSGALVTRSPWP
jgi:hypothetical protein